MSKKSIFVCEECNYQYHKWLGRCPTCEAWGSFYEVSNSTTESTLKLDLTNLPTPITEIDLGIATITRSGFQEFDRVLGKGIVAGSVILLAGEPGIGKSTLLLKVADSWAKNPDHPLKSTPLQAESSIATNKSLYISGEESKTQVASRAKRINCLNPNMFFLAETDVDIICEQINKLKPGLVIIDSIQTLTSSEYLSNSGSVTQIKQTAAKLTALAKTQQITIIIIGHVTKEGTISGPRTLEHMVDVVLNFEGETKTDLRILRGIKNRFGPANEIGCFKQSATGIIEVTDPANLFRQSSSPAIGSAITVSLDGRRALACEIQALTIAAPTNLPKRVVSGLDSNRVAVLLAVLEKKANYPLAQQEVYLSTIAGIKILEPAADLAIAMAIISTLLDKTLPEHTIILGEIGLTGEVRTISHLEQRLSEASRIGFTHALIPANTQTSLKNKEKYQNLKIKPITNLIEAITILF